MKKRVLSVILCLATLFSLFTATAFAAGSGDKLPFELTPPKNVYIVDRVGEYTPTTMEVYFDKTFELSEFISLNEDERNKLLEPLGYDDCWFNVEIDWAIDDPTDWKYQPDWDVYDRQRTETEWEFVRESGWVGSGVDHDMFQSAFIFDQYYFNAEDPTVEHPNSYWFGDENQPGVKSMLKDGQYEYITWGYENERYIDFDWTKHTLYIRMRYVATMDPLEGDRELIVGDWSKTFSYGKGVAPAKVYTAADADKLPAPHLSSLRVLRKGDKDYPSNYEGSGDLLAFTIDDFSDELRQTIMAVKANKDTARMEYIEVKFKGDTEWRQEYITSDLKAGVYYVPLADLAKEGETINASAYTQVRCVMLYSIYNGLGDDSLYPASNIITIGTPPVTTTTSSTTTTQSTTKPTTPTTTGAIKEAADKNIGAYTRVERVYGDNRYATCSKINDKFADVFSGNSAVCIATGADFPDALAGGVLAARKKAPMLLVSKTLTDEQAAYLKAASPDSVYVFGGPNAVGQEIYDTAKSYSQKAQIKEMK